MTEVAEYVDMTGYRLSVPKHPNRIVSLVPSLSLLLYDLGLADRLVGITKFCTEPPTLKQIATVVGGTKHVKYDRIDELHPDLILCNKEENSLSDVEHLRNNHPVWTSDISDLSEALHAIKSIGILTNKAQEAEAIVATIQAQRLAYERPRTSLKVLYLIWYNPWMSVGHDTFIHSMLGEAGFKNVLSDDSRYPELMVERLVSVSPDIIFLSSEPFPFKLKHEDILRTLLPGVPIYYVDGMPFSWYGSALLHSYSYFNELRKRIISE